MDTSPFRERVFVIIIKRYIGGIVACHIWVFSWPGWRLHGLSWFSIQTPFAILYSFLRIDITIFYWTCLSVKSLGILAISMWLVLDLCHKKKIISWAMWAPFKNSLPCIPASRQVCLSPTAITKFFSPQLPERMIT